MTPVSFRSQTHRPATNQRSTVINDYINDPVHPFFVNATKYFLASAFTKGNFFPHQSSRQFDEVFRRMADEALVLASFDPQNFESKPFFIAW